ncbi:MAG TPA: lytic transglycosylase domain-containing protein [Candidatus Angelobacter sp.]|nr:lytic transglycosylase domain-containing protein [Candidatus Angelobacter sp.]
MSFSKAFWTALLLVAGQLCASAADMAVLKNGATIPFLRKEQAGSVTRLYIPGGYMDIPTSQIASFDKDNSPLDYVTPDPPAEPAPAAAVPKAAIVHATAQKPSHAAAPDHRLTREEIDQFVREAANKYQLDPDFVASVIDAESNYNPHAISRKGAQGLMQLMPQTATRLGVKDAFDPQSNVEAGTAHLNSLLNQYHNDPIKALAAYNAGSHRVQQYHGVPPYRETRAYVARIVRDFNARKRAELKASAVAGKKASSGADKTAPNSKVAGKPAGGQQERASVD